jgi:uncharacterized protein YndB with AHSA1/START domain
MEPVKITVETDITAEINNVWTCWTAPEHIVNWNFASDEWHCPSAENNLRPGGKFRYVMASKDGEMSFDFEGVYNKVLPHNQITYTLTDGRKVRIEFEDHGETTRIRETFDAENENSPEMQKKGWQAILDNFKKYAEGY